MQWLNENDDVSLEYLHGAFNRDKKDGVSYNRFWTMVFQESSHKCSFQYFFLLVSVSVPTQQWTCIIFQFCCRCIYAVNTVLWCCFKTWMSWSWNLETVHEAFCKNNCQSFGCLCRYCQEGISKPSQGRKNCEYKYQSNPSVISWAVTLQVI